MKTEVFRNISEVGHLLERCFEVCFILDYPETDNWSRVPVVNRPSLHFPRPELAHDLALALRGEQAFADGPNGLFLAAPRRTGKSTFLQQDLAPALRSSGAIVVYVDLWADQSQDPADVLSESIAAELERHKSLPQKVLKRGGISAVDLAGWLKIEMEPGGRRGGTTLTAALDALSGLARSPVALIIDEAQQTLTSERGADLMSALKAARDTLNSPDIQRLMLVMSGSDRDKLLRLVNSSNAPFYGSRVHPMPLLGSDFIDFIAERLERDLQSIRQVDRARLLAAFEQLGSRPEFLSQAIGDALDPLSADESVTFEQRVLDAATERQEGDHDRMTAEFTALPHLQQAVLWRLLDQGERFRPYDSAALTFYASALSTLGDEERRLKPPQIQKAIDALRNRSPSLIWKSIRGEYALDESTMKEWYEAIKSSGEWPPRA